MGTLQVRLFLTYLAIIIVTLGLAAIGLFLLLGNYRDSLSYSDLESAGRLIDPQIRQEVLSSERSGQKPATDELLAYLSGWLNQGKAPDDRSSASVALIGADGRIISAAGTTAAGLAGARVESVDLRDLASGRVGATTPSTCRVDMVRGQDLLCVAMPLSSVAGTAFDGSGATAIVVAKPAASLSEVSEDLLPQLVFSGLIGLAAALLLGFLLSQSVAAPLRNIARAARNVARGNYRQRVPVTGPREVRDLASNFNRMTEEVQRSQQTLRDFLMNISHELKTPLTSIHGFSEAILDGTIDDQPGISRSARIISDESTRVLRLVEELLDLSRIESGQVLMRQEEVDLAELFGHVSEVFALRAEESEVRLLLEAAPDVRVRGDYDRLEQVLNNLLDNALRHTPKGGTVRLTSRPVQYGQVQVTVSDTGKGIPADDVPMLFDRFYRAANGRNLKGYGLGLAITREIVRAHGGDIWARSELGKGTEFIFTLPAMGAGQAPVSARRRRIRPAVKTPISAVKS